MLTEERITELESKGFKRWQKGNLDRLYINAAQLGLICTYYKTGNIHTAEMNGVLVSNSEGYRIKAAKTFVDVKTGKLYSDNEYCKDAAAALAGIEA